MYEHHSTQWHMLFYLIYHLLFFVLDKNIELK